MATAANLEHRSVCVFTSVCLFVCALVCMCIEGLQNFSPISLFLSSPPFHVRGNSLNKPFSFYSSSPSSTSPSLFLPLSPSISLSPHATSSLIADLDKLLQRKSERKRQRERERQRQRERRGEHENRGGRKSPGKTDKPKLHAYN